MDPLSGRTPTRLLGVAAMQWDFLLNTWAVFGRPLQVTVRPMLWDRCLNLSVCFCNINVYVSRPNGWINQDVTWYGGRPWHSRHCVRWGPTSSNGKEHSAPLLGQWLLCSKRLPSQQLLSSLSFCRRSRTEACVEFGKSLPARFTNLNASL